MKEDLKNDFLKFLRTLAIFAYGLLTIITCVGVWNAHDEAFVKVCAVLLSAVNAVVIYGIVKELNKSSKL